MEPMIDGKFDAAVFDLLIALLGSWTVWNRAAGLPADTLEPLLGPML